jgi:hypothetical protein
MYHNRHIDHIDFHIECLPNILCALLMFLNMSVWCKKSIVLDNNKINS